MNLSLNFKKLIFSFFVFSACLCVFSQEFYWERPVVVSKGDSRYSKAVSNESDSYAFWQEIDKSKKSIYLTVRYKNSDGIWVNNSRFAGPFSYSGEIPDIYSAAISSEGTVALAALSAGNKIAVFVSTDKCRSFRRFDFPTENGEFLAPRIFVTESGRFLLFCSLAKQASLGSVRNVLTHSFFIYGAVSEDGLHWSNFKPVFANEAFKNSFSPVVASNSQGAFLIFQSQYQQKDLVTYQLYSSFSGDNGKTWTSPILISDENSFEVKNFEYLNYDNQLPFAFSCDDEILVAWERNKPGADNSRICFAKINKSGLVPRSAEVIVDEGNARGAVLFSVNDGIYASWYAQNGRTDSVFYAEKDGFTWRKAPVETEILPSSSPFPLKDKGSIAFVWQESEKNNTGRIRFMAPDASCEKPGIIADKIKNGARTRTQKLKFRVSLPKDSSGIDGYVYSWSTDPSEQPVLDEYSLKLPSNNILNLFAEKEGVWYLKVCARDNAGNWSEPADFSVRLDLTPPKPVRFIEPELDYAGCLPSNTFSIKWNPDPSDDDIVGYNYEIYRISGINKKYVSTVRHPLKIKKTETSEYIRQLIRTNSKAIEKERNLSEYIKTRMTSTKFQNYENGLYVLAVAAIDETGFVGKTATIPFVLNKYVPRTQIRKINKSESIFGDVEIDILGKDFTVDGTVSAVIVDRDGHFPYDLVINASDGKFKVASNEKISSVKLGNVLDEGSYYVGIIHSDRGLCMTGTAALSITNSGTVKIENDYDYQPRWRAVTKTYSFRLYIGAMLLCMILILSLIGMIMFGIEFIKNCREYFSVLKTIDQISQGVLMADSVMENKKRKGTLKVSLSGFTISLVVFIIILLSVILGKQMIQEQNRTLSKGLHDRVDVLLSGLVSGTRSYLPSEDVLELSQLPRQMSSLDEAEFVSITGVPSKESSASSSSSLLHVWASNDPAITQKIDKLNKNRTNFEPGVSLMVKDVQAETDVFEICRAVNEEAVSSCSKLIEQLSALNSEGRNASSERRLEINEQMKQINVQLNSQFTELSMKSGGAIPAYNDRKLDRSVTEYIFYRPVLFRSGVSKDFVRGIVFVKVNTAALIREVDDSTRVIVYSVLIVALVAIGMGIIAALIFASRMVRPISRLEKAVKGIAEENNKELLLRNEIKNLPNNEIGRLGDSVNRLQRDLGFNARELNLQLNACEIQQGLVPLEPLAGNIKQNISKITDNTVSEFAYYKGAAGVSGDYFDFKKLDDRYYMLVKCDASGHAAPAGILVTMIATLYKKWTESWSFAKNGTKLEEFVYKANDFLESLNIKGKFVALIICLYDSKTGMLYMCHAGDKIYRIYDRTTGILLKNELKETPAVGPFPSFMVQMKGGFTVEKASLNPGDILLLYTDGIEENGRAKRKADYSPILRPKLNAEGEQIIDEYGNLEWETDKEEFGEQRVEQIFDAVIKKKKFTLTKEKNPTAGEVLEFDFTECEGTAEECIRALAAVEKVFRIYKPVSATSKDWVEVDTAIDGFLKDHFNLYSDYAVVPKDKDGNEIKPKNPNYVYYAFCKEDVQEDDLTVIAVQRPEEK